MIGGQMWPSFGATSSCISDAAMPLAMRAASCSGVRLAAAPLGRASSIADASAAALTALSGSSPALLSCCILAKYSPPSRSVVRDTPRRSIASTISSLSTSVRQNSSTAAGDVGRAAVRSRNSAMRGNRLISSTTAPLFAAATSTPCRCSITSSRWTRSVASETPIAMRRLNTKRSMISAMVRPRTRPWR